MHRLSIADAKESVMLLMR